MPIPKEKLKSIFEKFRQVDGSATRQHDGSALGLAILNQLVGLMNGQIHVESEQGEGSCFWFTVDLPAQKNAEKRNSMPIDSRGQADAGGGLIPQGRSKRDLAFFRKADFNPSSALEGT